MGTGISFLLKGGHHTIMYQARIQVNLDMLLKLGIFGCFNSMGKFVDTRVFWETHETTMITWITCL